MNLKNLIGRITRRKVTKTEWQRRYKAWDEEKQEIDQAFKESQREYEEWLESQREDKN